MAHYLLIVSNLHEKTKYPILHGKLTNKPVCIAQIHLAAELGTVLLKALATGSLQTEARGNLSCKYGLILLYKFFLDCYGGCQRLFESVEGAAQL